MSAAGNEGPSPPAAAASGSRPALSVVVASVSGRRYLDACLAALAAQEGVAGEVIVADRIGPEVAAHVLAEHPAVTLLEFDGPTSIPELRSAAIAASSGPIVAITEDHCIPPPGWYREVVEAHRRADHPAIGGAVDNAATDSVVDWAVFFCEYSKFISPVPEGVVDDLPGPNVSYKRWVLEEMGDLLRDGYWETFLHGRLAAKGHALWSDPRVRMDHKKHYRLGEFLVERFHFGRAFAGKRNESLSRGRRLLYWLGSGLLPPVLLLRIARRVFDRNRHLVAFLKAVPALALFVIAWAAGESTGYLLGPGDSDRKFV